MLGSRATLKMIVFVSVGIFFTLLGAGAIPFPHFRVRTVGPRTVLSPHRRPEVRGPSLHLCFFLPLAAFAPPPPPPLGIVSLGEIITRSLGRNASACL